MFASIFQFQLVPTKGRMFLFTNTTLMGIQARWHHPSQSPTREGSHWLWELPASALTLMLAKTDTLRTPPGTLTALNAKSQRMTLPLHP
ncbi:hypothetical protein AVEN_142290-1 [Araneus ventricosus]|uniref:Uncharacterized protein n=1 Tax=Araneus ventricosus TaxID=182803 RepID=A0A4Y2N0R8_ARAVE|nr:hypothetical protein AVEN_142290-1 [Araneus ventricosus]